MLPEVESLRVQFHICDTITDNCKLLISVNTSILCMVEKARLDKMGVDKMNIR